MFGIRLKLCTFLCGIAVSDVCAVEVYTPVELQAVNGTDARLKCTFTSSAPISVQASVSWNFRPLSGGIEESVFYYQEQPYTPTSGKFKGRAVWSGDIRRGDASITIRDLKFSDNGTYSCHVKNPPEDVHGQAGELQLRVVSTVSHSEMKILLGAMGGAIVLAIVLIVTVASIRACRQHRRQRTELEKNPQYNHSEETECLSLEHRHEQKPQEEVEELKSSQEEICQEEVQELKSSQEEICQEEVEELKSSQEEICQEKVQELKSSLEKICHEKVQVHLKSDS
ncbi:myelin protein zero-like protein 2b [Polyodon spathula]|uniref:myelin protein zero-like protein 2b n=1 Tax=Polyodon spathula TaxID=7913 RepID=UPI001B7E8DBA|nr:myelin protein zero-like protein 2b [Polyodon spathula]